MKTSFRPILFAGRPEYMQDLQQLRERVKPLYDELKLDITVDKTGEQLRKVEKRQAELKKQPPSLVRTLQLKALRAREIALAARALVGAFVQYGADMDGKAGIRAHAKSQEAGEAYDQKSSERAKNLNQLREVVKRLRGETDPAKDAWLQEFEQETQQPLDKTERFVLNKWNA
ncbi:MAG TPA: hypothetical protein V6C52_09555 [Coleofasciculaceae cyanobacterium]|jgi:hypothetical protein